MTSLQMGRTEENPALQGLDLDGAANASQHALTLLTRVHFHRALVTVPRANRLPHASATTPPSETTNNPHDPVVDPVNGRITGVWALNENDLRGPPQAVASILLPGLMAVALRQCRERGERPTVGLSPATRCAGLWR